MRLIVLYTWTGSSGWRERRSFDDNTALLGFPDASTLLPGVVRRQDAVMPTHLLVKVESCVVFFRRASRMGMEFCCLL